MEFGGRHLEFGERHWRCRVLTLLPQSLLERGSLVCREETLLLLIATGRTVDKGNGAKRKARGSAP